MRMIFKIFRILLVVIPISLLVIYYCNREIEACAANKLYNNVSDVPYNRVGLLLGTGKFLRNGMLH
jgi:SanA protein